VVIIRTAVAVLSLVLMTRAFHAHAQTSGSLSDVTQRLNIMEDAADNICGVVQAGGDSSTDRGRFR